MYKLNFEKRALRDLNKLDKPIKKRIQDKLKDTKNNPFHYFEKLVETEGFNLRIGDWRVIVDIDKVNEVIMVLKIGHRKNIYDR